MSGQKGDDVARDETRSRGDVDLDESPIDQFVEPVAGHLQDIAWRQLAGRGGDRAHGSASLAGPARGLQRPWPHSIRTGPEPPLTPPCLRPYDVPR